MKCIKTIVLSSTQLCRQLSYDEVSEMNIIIYNRILELMRSDSNYREIDSVVTQSFWLTLEPHFMHFDMDIKIIDGGNNNHRDFRDQFNGPITFFYNEPEFRLAKELYYLQNFKTYNRNNITITV